MNNLGSTPIHDQHTKFQGHPSSGSGEEDFLKFLPYIGRRFFRDFAIYVHGGLVGHVTQLIYINFHSFSPSSFHMNFGSKSPNCF